MVEQKLIADKKILFADSFTQFSYADIEDFFTQDDYLNLYNGAFEAQITVGQLDKSKGHYGAIKAPERQQSF